MLFLCGAETIAIILPGERSRLSLRRLACLCSSEISERRLCSPGANHTRRMHKESDTMTYATRLSLTRRKPLAAPSRPATLARSLARLEREHVALLLALSELDASADATLTPDSALRAALAPLLRGDLRRTQYALSRADAGLYGVCDGCGRSIAARRLELNPATTRCSACEAHARA